MGLNSWADYQRLNRMKYYPRPIVFAKEVKPQDLHLLHSRVRLAKSFNGIDAEGYGSDTMRSYNALCKVFLTQSALERFIAFMGLDDPKIKFVKKLDKLSDLMLPYGPEEVVKDCFDRDKKGLLYDVMYEYSDNRLRERVRWCRSGESANIAYLSASIRNIFAHGNMAANTNDLTAPTLEPICGSVSSFLLDFIDAEFTKKIDACYERIRAK
ncbi:MAG: hypothetical protein M3P49_08835 [Actinomycetota bacterium]|nr:hypothetical protein [Actinomycetota bacterium]